MPRNEPPTKEELLTLIQERREEPDISALPYKEQQDIVNDPDHPLRAEMKRRDQKIRHGLDHHGLSEADLEPE